MDSDHTVGVGFREGAQLVDVASTLSLMDCGNASPISPSIHSAFALTFTESEASSDVT